MSSGTTAVTSSLDARGFKEGNVPYCWSHRDSVLILTILLVSCCGMQTDFGWRSEKVDVERHVPNPGDIEMTHSRAWLWC